MDGKYYHVDLYFDFRSGKSIASHNDNVLSFTDSFITINLMADLGYKTFNGIIYSCANTTNSLENAFIKYLNKPIESEELLKIILKGSEHVVLNETAITKLNEKFKNKNLIIKDLFEYVEFHYCSGGIIVSKFSKDCVHIVFSRN